MTKAATGPGEYVPAGARSVCTGLDSEDAGSQEAEYKVKEVRVY